jgi:DNA ligase-1
MRRFTDLYLALDASTKTTAKIEALTDYFASEQPHDAAWATFFLTGRKLKRLVGTRDLVAAALEASGVSEWLFQASYAAVGDLAETVALLLPPPSQHDERSLARWVEVELAPLAGLPSRDVQARLRAAWNRLDRDERFVFGKLLTGAFRVGAARQLVYRALAQATGVPLADVAHRLIGPWTPSPAFFDMLRDLRGDAGTPAHRPYPFFLAHALAEAPETLGDIGEWQAEWKWDGIRAQLLVRADGASVWSRGEELVSDTFPEIVEAARAVPPGTVIDGELLAWSAGDELPLPFASLQQRLNRKAPGPKLRRDVPVVLLAYDLLELGGEDLRARPLRERRAALETLLPIEPTLKLSPRVFAADWRALDAQRARSREHRAEGIMLKRLDSPYGVGRVRGPWWKWKIDPYTIDAVLVYAQPGSGRRASLLTDYTFAVRGDDGELVPFAKAYSGLSDAEIRAVDNWIRNHTLERFGPVRRVEPLQVFELAFEGLQVSTRHKSGVATRFPRIARWRKDKPACEADTLRTLKALAGSHAGGDALEAPDPLERETP